GRRVSGFRQCEMVDGREDRCVGRFSVVARQVACDRRSVKGGLLRRPCVDSTRPSEKEGIRVQTTASFWRRPIRNGRLSATFPHYIRGSGDLIARGHEFANRFAVLKP